MLNNVTSVTVNNVNDAKITNNVTSRSVTGNNSASWNTLGGSVKTGNATLDSSVTSVANINTTNISVGYAGSSNAGANDVTGPDSTNYTYINNEHRANVYNSNTANVTNNVDSFAGTGRNLADYNTGPASVETGNANVNSVVGIHANDSYTALSLGAGGTGNNTAGSSTTGPLSSNYSTINNALDVTVNNVNDLLVSNDVRTFAGTGRNSASWNTLGGSIDTGSASTGVGVETEGNINTTGIIAAMGGFGNTAGNSITGPDSTNESFINNAREVVVDNWNNKCQSHNMLPPVECDPQDLGVVNDVESFAGTGANIGDYNTGAGDVVSGFAALVEQVVTHLNDVLNSVQL